MTNSSEGRKPTHGGPRPNSGRKPSPHGPTTRVPVPVKLLAAFRQWLVEQLDTTTTPMA